MKDFTLFKIITQVFKQYFKKFFNKPYDNYASVTLENCDYIIQYTENINEDYKTALKNAGVKNPKPLPLANKTVGKKSDINEYYTEEIQSLALFVFGPFLEKYNYNIPSNWKFKNIFFFSFSVCNWGVFKKA